LRLHAIGALPDVQPSAVARLTAPLGTQVEGCRGRAAPKGSLDSPSDRNPGWTAGVRQRPHRPDEPPRVGGAASVGQQPRKTPYRRLVAAAPPSPARANQRGRAVSGPERHPPHSSGALLKSIAAPRITTRWPGAAISRSPAACSVTWPGRSSS